MACHNNWDLGSVVRSCNALHGSSLKTNPSLAMAAKPHNTMSSINNDTLLSPNGHHNQFFGVSNDNSILQANNPPIGPTSSIDMSHMTQVDQDRQSQNISYPNFSASFNSPLLPQNPSMHAHAKVPPSSSMMHDFNQPTFPQPQPSCPSMTVIGKLPSNYIQKVQKPQVSSQGRYYVSSIMSSQSRPKGIGRRNLRNKISRQVTREDMGNDEWTWRKYGQKIIKGSIHPRSYYRCISAKGCSARKQVQLSPKEPNMFIITYTGDHTHARLPNSRTRYPRPDSPTGSSGFSLMTTKNENSNLNFMKQVLQVDDVDSIMNDHKLDAMMAHDHDHDDGEGGEMHVEDIDFSDDFFKELEQLDIYQNGGCNAFGDFSFDDLLSSPTWAPGNSSTGDGCDGSE